MKRVGVLMGAMLFLSACGAGGGVPVGGTDVAVTPSPEPEAWVERLAEAAAGVDDAAARRTLPTDGSFLTIVLETWEAYLNGAPMTLEGTPYVEDRVLYLPAQELIEAMGGYFAFDAEGETIVMGYKPWCGFKQRTVLSYQVGVDTGTLWYMSQEGTWKMDVWKPHTYVSGHRELSAYNGDGCPVLRGETVYIPAGYFPGNSQWAPSQNAIVFEWYDRLDGAEGWMTDVPYEALPCGLREGLRQTVFEAPYLPEQWAPEQPSPFLVNQYENQDIQIETLQWSERMAAEEQRNGVETVSTIRLLSDRYQTTRGLRVGDSLQRFELLYGVSLGDAEAQSYSRQGFDENHGEIYEFEHGAIAQITFFYNVLRNMELQDEKNTALSGDEGAEPLSVLGDQGGGVICRGKDLGGEGGAEEDRYCGGAGVGAGDPVFGLAGGFPGKA